MDNQAFKLLMDKLQGIDKKLSENDKRFNSFHETLSENTFELKKHVRGSIATNKRLAIVEDKMDHVDKHVTSMQKVSNLFVPTKKKMIWVMTAISLFFAMIKAYEYILTKIH